MKDRIHSPVDWRMICLGGVGIPGLFIAGMLAAGKPEVAGMIGVLTCVFLVPVALGALTAHFRTPATDGTTFTTATELAPEVIADIESIPGLELVESFPAAPRTGVELEAAAVTGSCAYGFASGDTWTIDSKGNLSRPICAAAAEAFKELYLATPGAGTPTEMSCRCPLADRKVTSRRKTEA